MKHLNFFILLLAIVFMPVDSAYSGDAAADGTYDAEVTTESGTYTVPVEVENGEVTHVEWPNGGAMHVYGGELTGGSASGTNSRGESVDIQISDPSYNSEPNDE